MRSALVTAALLLTVCVATRADHACPTCPPAACAPIEFPVLCEPVWAVGLDWVLLGRDRPDSATELVGCNCTDDNLRFRANQFEPDSGSGGRVRAYRRNPTGVDYEFAYLDVTDWTDRRDFAGDLRVLGTDLGTTSTAFARFDSQLRGIELNALIDTDAWTRWSAGLRWMQLDEFAETGGSGGLATVAASSDVRNQLLGSQVGVRWLIFDLGGPWTADLALETGLYANWIDRNTTGFGATPLDSTRLSSVSEVELGVAYAFSPCWSLNLGAQFLWLTNVASAPEQFGTPGSIEDASTVFYAGGSFGLTRSW